MSKEKYLEELSDKLRISKPVLKKIIYTVGTNKENIKNYAKNGFCAIVRKDNGFDVSYVAQMLNEKDAKIKDLEHRLSNCIEPKFKVGQEVWIIHLRKVKKSKIFLISWDNNFIFRYGLEGGGYLLEKFEDELFITAEEALKKLEEL